MEKIWAPHSWKDYKIEQDVHYEDPVSLNKVLEVLHSYPPLVFIGEVESLKRQLAEASYGKAFLLQGGDCAESFEDCNAQAISNKVKILLQMASVLCYGSQKPIVCSARIAGQYAKPRSYPFEVLGGKEIPVFRGESVNGFELDANLRKPDPFRLLKSYHSSALTLNYIRSMASGGFGDFHHPEQWEMELFKGSHYYEIYHQITINMKRAIDFIRSLGGSTSDLRQMNFFTCHEGLHLPFEQSQTHYVSSRQKYYNLGAHMLWIGDRTRQLDGAHVEYFRGIANPIGIKVGISADPEDILRIVNILNPENEAGKITLITRLGVENVTDFLPKLLKTFKDTGKHILWSCDPMHGNTVKSLEKKTRHFSSIFNELKDTFEIHKEHGTHLGGVHFELTGENVTECIGGIQDLKDHHLDENYTSQCDPRLNYHQSMEIAFLLAEHIGKTHKIMH